MTMNATEAIAMLNDSYELIYVNYDDKLSDDQVEALVSGDVETFWSSLWDFEVESRSYGIDYVVRDTFDGGEWEAMTTAEQDEVRYEIEERDSSDWVNQLIRHTSNPLLRTWAIDEDHGWAFQPVTAADVLAEIGFEASEHNVTVLNEALAECAVEYSVILGQWIFSIDLALLYGAGDSDKVRITNPYLHLGNPFSGSGWITTKPLHGVIEIERKELHTDAAGFGYSMNDIYGGLRASDFTAEAEIVQTQEAPA